MTYPVKHVANCFLQKDFEDGKATITPMKMQKLVYFLHGWHLAITGKPVIEDTFRAWQYGPVEENLYHMLKSYRGKQITRYLKENSEGTEKAFVVSKDAEMFYKILDKKSAPSARRPCGGIESTGLVFEFGAITGQWYKNFKIRYVMRKKWRNNYYPDNFASYALSA